MENKVLIVEDEESIRGFIKINLKRNNFKVIEASSGEEAIEKANLEKPDVIILDIMLPGIDGFKTCEILRKYLKEVGIIMLTARTQDMDKIMGLEFGADDYVTKPFNPLELIARINALLRRINKSNLKKENSEIISGEFKLNTQSRKLYKNNKEIELTPKEYLIIKNFMENEDKAFTRDEILNLVWGYDYFGDNKIVDVNIRRIREKIEHNPSQPNYIETIWGVGYRWRKD
ncbi:alkaline phosphatase synthesis transcriptional regulatory protein PhoP [Clostridium acetireducens DSM 10703]|uniref:Stage 0 sporulation protein A homolog n=1 Tax=Clostridium acetireducens DSM 10703 TaxID=1121290 RepID=A0A1E8F0T0_9CLOT|nr:response regulator transcription factor [Clostridium acetireducens]OFI06760.1 alkaline phosphatase synthesis transcriptional regulatory protein PhoP [Clostridium acetireducens DSM 10703]